MREHADAARSARSQRAPSRLVSTPRPPIKIPRPTNLDAAFPLSRYEREDTTMKNMTNETARKAVCAALLAGGLFGAQAKAAIPSVPERVAAVRTELNKRVAEAQ